MSKFLSPTDPSPAFNVCVVLVQGATPLGRLIRWQTYSDFSHAALYVGGMVFEAREGHGVVMNSWHMRGWRGNEPVFILPLDDELAVQQRARLIGFLTKQVGKKYDYRSVARFVSRRQMDRPDDRWFCSELVFQALLNVGVQLLPRIEACRVSPALLAVSAKLRVAYGWNQSNQRWEVTV